MPTKKQAQNRIDQIVDEVEKLWKEATQLANEHRIDFYATDPSGHSSLQYYPPRPDDWEEGYFDYDDDPNKDHAEWEEYHPWNNGLAIKGGWVSSSDRC